VKISLRTYRPEDFDALCEIDRVCYSRETAYSAYEMQAYLAMAGAECLVAEVRGSRKFVLAGFCISARHESLGYVITMDVLEEFRRHGIGTALLGEAEKRLSKNGVATIGLETAVDNAAGVAFWQHHGYRTHRVRKGYYPGGVDAYSMTKKIAPSKTSKR